MAYNDQKEERMRRDAMYQIPKYLDPNSEIPIDQQASDAMTYNPVEDAKQALETLKVANLQAKFGKELEKADKDIYNPINMTPEDKAQIELTKQDSIETDKVNQSSYMDLIKQFQDARKQGITDTEMAFADKRNTDALAMIVGGMNKVAAGYGGGKATQLKSDNETSEMMQKMGASRLNEIRELANSRVENAKQGISDLQIQRQLEENDPNSQASQSYRNNIKSLTGMDMPANMTAEKMKELFPLLAKKLDYANEKQMLQMKIAAEKEIAGLKDKSRGLQLTPGQEKEDTEFAKEWVNYQTKKGDFQKSLAALKSAREEIVKGSKGSLFGTSGIVSGLGQSAGILQDDKAIAQKVQSAALAGLKSVYTGTMSDKDVELYSKSVYDPYLKPEHNLDKIEREIAALENKSQNIESKGSYFKETGTTKNYMDTKAFPEATNTQPISTENKTLGSADRLRSTLGIPTVEKITRTINGVTYVKVPGGWEVE